MDVLTNLRNLLNQKPSKHLFACILNLLKDSPTDMKEVAFHYVTSHLESWSFEFKIWEGLPKKAFQEQSLIEGFKIHNWGKYHYARLDDTFSCKDLLKKPYIEEITLLDLWDSYLSESQLEDILKRFSKLDTLLIGNSKFTDEVCLVLKECPHPFKKLDLRFNNQITEEGFEQNT